jgi:glutamine amidotransferase
MKIAIVDYGMGNIKSINGALKHLGASDVSYSSDFNILNTADKLILPGVGSFAKAMKQIKDKKIDQILNEIVIGNNKPILGICLGMQLLGKSSDEDGFNEGLGFVDAEVKKFTIKDFKIPHVGFNQVIVQKEAKLYSGIADNSDFYFTHSYRMMSKAKLNASYCSYGETFIASFEYGNIAGVQFHPELSQHNGLKLLTNFIYNF